MTTPKLGPSRSPPGFRKDDSRDNELHSPVVVRLLFLSVVILFHKIYIRQPMMPLEHVLS